MRGSTLIRLIPSRTKSLCRKGKKSHSNLVTEGSAQIYLKLTSFDKGLRGAFQIRRGLNHFQPMMVFSFKHPFFTFPLLRFK